MFLAIVSVFSSVLVAQDGGYEIKATIKPLKNQWVYLGHYFGKQTPLDDSAYLNEKSEIVFKGPKKLGGGIYLLALPKYGIYTEFLVDKEQKFSIVTDSSDMTGHKRFINSPDNEAFSAYQSKITTIGRSADSLRKRIRSNPSDSIKLSEKLSKVSEEMISFRKSVLEKNKGSLLGVLLNLMVEPEVPADVKKLTETTDSLASYRYTKAHYWDGINFWDERICRTPATLLDERLNNYFQYLVYPNPDSTIKEIDWMMGYSSGSKYLQGFLLAKFINRYFGMKYMWEDKIFVHLFEKYINDKEYDWLKPKEKKMVTERAYMLMSNLMGNPAPNVSLKDQNGVTRNLYDLQAPLTVLIVWDANCGHCKETLPRVDSIYQAKWKAQGIKIYTLSKQTDGTKQDWLDFITKNHLFEWVNVFYSKEEQQKMLDAGVASYVQQFDAQVVPAIFLLDKDKKISAKKLAFSQIDEIIKLKLDEKKK